MLYFEDFMEDIEDIPEEFTETLTAMRQLDLQVQNIMEPLDSGINDFFNKCNHNGFLGSHQQNEYEKIIKSFDEAEVISKDKICLSDQLKETFNKMMKKLDNELSKFKLELEADNPGNAEAIEQMVNKQLQAGAAEMTQRVERKRIKRGRLNTEISGCSQIMTRKLGRSEGYGLKSERSDSCNNSTSAGVASTSAQNDAIMTSVINGSISPASSFMGAVSTPYSTKRKSDWKSNQGERSTKSERRKFKLMSTASEDSGTNEDIDEGRKQDGMSETGSSRTPASLNFGGCGVNDSTSSYVMQLPTASQYGDDNSVLDLDGMGGSTIVGNTGNSASGSGSIGGIVSGSGVGSVGGDLSVVGASEDEPRYCFCNEVSYGDMIACDAPNCPREWFHYGCVNLVVAPKGSWYCRECKMKQKQQQHQHHQYHHHQSRRC